DGREVHAGSGDAPDGRVLVLDDEVRMPAQLLDVLRQADVLVVDVGLALTGRGVAADAVPQGELELAHAQDWPAMAGSSSGCSTKAFRSSWVYSSQSAPRGMNAPPDRTR